MINREDYESLLNNLRSRLDATSVALISEELLALNSAYTSAYEEFEKILGDNAKLRDDKEELLKVNGRLYQKIGFDREEKENDDEEKEEKEEKIKIEDVINEKGELI